MRYFKSLSRLFSFTNIFSFTNETIKAEDRGFKNGFEVLSFYNWSFVLALFEYLQFSHLCLWVIWYKMLSHFSLSSLAYPLEVGPHRKKWLIMAFIHSFSSSKRFCLHRFTNSFLIFLPTCQTSKWWFILPFYACNDGLASVSGKTCNWKAMSYKAL